jgi:hypothetical protein
MKKLFVVFAMIISLNLACEKRMCACFNPPPITFNLVVKGTQDKDLLNPSTVGNFAKEQIKLYKVEADGSHTPLKFDINKPIPTGNAKLSYYQLVSPDLVIFDRSNPNTGYFTKVAFLQFGSETPYKVDLSYDQSLHKLSLTLNGIEVPRDEKMLPFLNTLFYFSKK